MNVVINQSVANGVVKAPPSKSMAHRSLICGAFSENSIVENVAFSEDIKATLNCIKALGGRADINKDTVNTGGIDLKALPENIILDCNESGSTLRFFIPICMAAGKKITLKGTPRLFERPLSIYAEIAEKQGIYFEKGNDYVTVCGSLKSGKYFVRGDVSSQFITGLLFALPLLCGNSTLTVTGKFESASYINLTLKALNDFGIYIERNKNVFKIKGSQKYKSGMYSVEGDCSNAAFLEGFNLLGGSVSVTGLSPDTLQGDRVYTEIFYGLKNGQKQFDLSDCPDLAPVAFAMAAVTGGAVFTGTARLKIKESDRAAAMRDELAKFGINVSVAENSVTVAKGEIKKPTVPICGHNDHRIVMALSLLCSITGGTVTGAQAVAKSYPDFFSKIRSIGIDVNEIN